MESSDFLLLGIEVSVAFAGFAGIVATFQFRDRTKVKRGDIVGLTMIVQNSLLVAFSCALPLILHIFGLDDRTVWLVASVWATVIGALGMYVVDKNMRGAVSRKSQKLFIGSMQALAAATVLMSFLNAADIIFHRVPGPYFVGIILHLGMVGHLFARLLLRPLWHSLHLREQEHELSGANVPK